MRNMGGLKNTMKTTFWVYLIGAVALSGIPPLAGFWSKDEILADASGHFPVIYVVLTIAAIFTAFYMTRQMLMVFFGKPRSLAAEHAQESPRVMTVPLMVLAALSLLGGFINLPFEGFHNFGHWLEHTIGELAHAGEFNLGVAGLSTLLAVGGILVGYWLYNPRRFEAFWNVPSLKRGVDPLVQYIGPFFKVLNEKYRIDELYDAAIVQPYRGLSQFLSDVVDWRFWHDWFHEKVIYGGFNLLTRLLSVRVDLGGIDAIANGIGRLTAGAAGGLRRIQTGYVRNYALSIFIGLVVILSYLLLR
jgi:NADH-quinone oxidoreductase subunit L